MTRLLFVLILIAAPLRGEPLRVAVAANYATVIGALNAAFHKTASNVETQVVLGSSGNLTAQITHGAPFDVFLAANLDYPKSLIASGHAAKDTFIRFASGKLVFWMSRAAPGEVDLADAIRARLHGKIAVANPATAPYGIAAMETLRALGLSEAVKPALVTGENISQTAQFVASGHADAGFVALSLLKAPGIKPIGAWILVPDSLHAPIIQGAVLTMRGAARPEARQYLRFLQSPPAQRVLERFGYGVPATR